MYAVGPSLPPGQKLRKVDIMQVDPEERGTFLANKDLAAQLFVLGCRSGKSTVSPSSGYGQHVVALQHALISHYISKQRVATSTVLVSWISGSFCAILSSLDFGICD